MEVPVNEIHLKFDQERVQVTDQWVVLLNTGTDIYAYGPMEAGEAQAFARFMTKEVDPATAFKLRSPLREVLGWHESELARNNCTHGDDCPEHPDVKRLHGMTGTLGFTGK